MDQPIIYRTTTLVETITPEEPVDLFERLKNAVIVDDEDEFLRLIKDPAFELVRGSFQADRIFRADAIKIAIAVLNGKTRGIIDIENVLKDEQTPLHLAAYMCAPKVTKYLIQRGDRVHADDPCDWKLLHLKQAIPVELALEMIEIGFTKNGVIGYLGALDSPWTPRRSIFELLHYVCEIHRSSLEVVRMLVQNTFNKKRIRQAFFDYAEKGKLVQLAALFLAAPEFFARPYLISLEGEMSSIDVLYLSLNSVEKRTDIADALSLLVDVFALVGHKLAAYIRVDDLKVWELCPYSKQFKIGFFIREVADKKLGISSREDYLLSFFKPLRQEVGLVPDWWLNIDRDECLILPFRMKKKDINMDYVNRMIPSLNQEDAAVLNTAIENKLSIMPNLRKLFQDMIIIPNKGGKHVPLRSSLHRGRSFEPSVRSFCTTAANAKGRFDFKVTPTKGWECRVMKLTKLESFFTVVRLSHFPMIAKRLIK